MGLVAPGVLGAVVGGHPLTGSGPVDYNGGMFEELSPPYSTVVIDPPWPYKKINPDNGTEGHRGKNIAYSTMTIGEIKAMPVGDLVVDGRCFLWTTNRFLRCSWDILEAWGFTPMDRTLVWCKDPKGTTPVTTEFVLIGKKGHPEPALPWHNTTWFNWPRQPVHSQKPDAFMDLVEQWCPGPYVEIFSRRPRFNWDSWGFGYE